MHIKTGKYFSLNEPRDIHVGDMFLLISTSKGTMTPYVYKNTYKKRNGAK